MNTGFILLHRSLMQNGLYHCDETCRMMAWIDLLLMANHSNSSINVRGVQVKVPRGTVARSSETLAANWRWSRGKVLRFLKQLENEHQIVQLKTGVITLITIVNYDKFQKVVQKTRQKTGQKTDIKRDTYKEEENNEKENGQHPALAGVPSHMKIPNGR